MPRFASVLLVDPRGWVLLQERDEHPAIDPDRWGAPGGHVEEAEAPEAAAYRELEEETGIALPPGSLALLSELEVWHEAFGSLDAVHVYAGATTVTDDDVECHEGRRIVFVDPDTALGLPLTASASLALPAFLSSELYRTYRKLATP